MTQYNLYSFTKILVALILVSFYIYVLYLSLNPDVSDDYYQYYIEKSTDLSPYQQRVLERGDPVFVITPFAGDYVEFTGWSEARGGNRWSLDDDAFIHFRLPDDKGVNGKIVISARYFSNQVVSVLLNGVKLESYKASGEMEVTIEIQPHIFEPDDNNELHFLFSNPQQPGGGDQRKIAMGLAKISIY